MCLSNVSVQAGSRVALEVSVELEEDTLFASAEIRTVLSYVVLHQFLTVFLVASKFANKRPPRSPLL